MKDSAMAGQMLLFVVLFVLSVGSQVPPSYCFGTLPLPLHWWVCDAGTQYTVCSDLTGAELVDVNDDGLVDFVQSFQSQFEKFNTGMQLYFKKNEKNNCLSAVCLNTGIGWNCSSEYRASTTGLCVRVALRET